MMISPQQVKGHLKIKTRRESKEKKFNRMFQQELKQIPAEFHGRVATVVQKKVDLRVKEYMKDIREDVNKKLEV